ncbi:hypothetical protein D3C73_1269450 [compost metagenome]
MQAVSQVQAEKHQALGAGHPVTGIEYRQAQRRDAEHHRQVEFQRIRRYRQGRRRDQRRQAKHAQEVEQIAADHVAYGNFPFTAQGGDQGSGQLRE